MNDQASWFVAADETVRLPLDLPGEHWIEVKAELSYAETQNLQSALMNRFTVSGQTANGKPGKEPAEGALAIDAKRYAVARIRAWVVDWSAVGPGGKRIEITNSAIENLRPAIAAAIDRALDQHVEAIEMGKATPSADASARSWSS